MNVTSPGTVLGTLGYLSPEQARGEDVDARSDLFAFGAVFFEMLTGRPAFTRPSGAETIAAVLYQQPPRPSSLNPAVPAACDAIVEKALEKRRELRYQSAVRSRRTSGGRCGSRRAARRCRLWARRSRNPSCRAAYGVGSRGGGHLSRPC